MFDNAKQYNAEGSDVYLDAEELQQLFWKSIGKNGRGRQSKGKRPRKHENELQEVFHNGEVYKVGTFRFCTPLLVPMRYILWICP